MKKILCLVLAAAALATACGPKQYEYLEQELLLESGGKQIYGLMYYPKGMAKAPLIVMCHGFGGSYAHGLKYAKAYAPLGYAVYSFDFCGGSASSRSEGSTAEMSIFTEQADLEAVLDQLCQLSYIDTSNITLVGESQGGMVSAMVAAARPDQIDRLILIYPAFNIRDDWVTMYPKLEDMQADDVFWGVHLSHVFLKDLYDFDVYGTIAKYEGPVAIFHGVDDTTVPVEYSVKAEKAYKNATLTVYPGEGHGFKPAAEAKTLKTIQEMLK
jgi:hypothetical protein